MISINDDSVIFFSIMKALLNGLMLWLLVYLDKQIMKLNIMRPSTAYNYSSAPEYA